jgi:hypothetical protein
MTDRRTHARFGITTGAFILTLAVVMSAGTSFRLEIGPPVAAGANFITLKRAVLVVRALVCDDLAAVRITGTAEGVLNGRRQTLPLKLILVNTSGVYAVQHDWPMDGQWILHLSGTCPSPMARASTIIPMRKSTFIRDKVQVLREPATGKQIESALADLARKES